MSTLALKQRCAVLAASLFLLVMQTIQNFYAFATRQCQQSFCAFGLSIHVYSSFHSLVCSSEQISQYLMNALSSLDDTYSEYSLAPTADLIRYFGSQRSRSQQAIEVGKASTLILECRSPCSNF